MTAPEYIIHACPERMWYVNKLLVPSLLGQGIEREQIKICEDKTRRGNLTACMEIIRSCTGDGGARHLQDDVIICCDFAERTAKRGCSKTKNCCSLLLCILYNFAGNIRIEGENGETHNVPVIIQVRDIAVGSDETESRYYTHNLGNKVAGSDSPVERMQNPIIDSNAYTPAENNLPQQNQTVKPNEVESTVEAGLK